MAAWKRAVTRLGTATSGVADDDAHRQECDMRCRHHRCWRPTVGVSAWCRAHTDLIYVGGETIMTVHRNRRRYFVTAPAYPRYWDGTLAKECGERLLDLKGPR